MHNSQLENSKCEDMDLRERVSVNGRWCHWEIGQSAFSHGKIVELTNNLSVQILGLLGTKLG